MTSKGGIAQVLVLLVFVVGALSGCREDKQSEGAPEPERHAELQFNTQLVSHFNKYATDGYSNVWGYTAPDGTEYALVGARGGTSIVDITTDGSPVERAYIPGPFSHWRELKSYSHYAYVVTEAGGGLQIIDLANLPVSASLVQTFSGFSRAHTVTIDESRAILYIGGGEGSSAKAFSLVDPEHPTEIGPFDTDHYVHDQSAQGTRGYLAEGGSGTFSIWDLTDPAAPVRLVRWRADDYTGANATGVGTLDPGHDSSGGGAAGYAHNIWATDDEDFVITTEETNGKTVKKWHLSDLAHPHVAAEYLGPNGLAHNAHIKGNFVYLAHYSAGLRVLDLSGHQTLTEVAAYAKAGSYTGGYTGVWGVYPFFKSGKILLSDIEDGLYVVYFAGAVAR